MKITGIFAPVPTPFASDGSLDIEAWRINLRIWKESALDGIVICGSNGEMPFVTQQERVALTEIAAEEAGANSCLWLEHTSPQLVKLLRAQRLSLLPVQDHFCCCPRITSKEIRLQY